MINRAFNFVTRTILPRLLLGRVSDSTYFKYIYKTNYWEDPDSRSGPGSNMLYTAVIQATLPIIFEDLGIRTVFDAPCGDFHWMSEVVSKAAIDYIGGDLVEALVKQNATKWRALSNTKFITFDVTRDEFPNADLWICRDLHFHLSNADVARSLGQFCKSNIKYALLTSHTDTSAGLFENQDITSGGFRLLDITNRPFCLPRTPLYRFDDYIEPHPPREMLLYDSEQIASSLPTIMSTLGLSR